MRTKSLAISILLAAALLFSGVVQAETPAAPAQSFQIGLHIGGAPFEGITIKKRITSRLVLEGLANLNDGIATGAGRILFDLGNRGNVFRYTGFGVGGGVTNLSLDPMSIIGVQAFIGLDTPLAFFSLTSPFSFSAEIVLQLTQMNGQLWTATGLNTGWHYWF